MAFHKYLLGILYILVLVNGSDPSANTYQVFSRGQIQPVAYGHANLLTVLIDAFELNTCYRDHPAGKAKNIYYVALCGKTLLVPAVGGKRDNQY